MIRQAYHRFLSPEPNVGGGDLGSRVFAALVLFVLAALLMATDQVPYRIVKISLLASAEMGLVFLMIGMFLRSKTYYAGGQLSAAPLIMLACASRDLEYVGAITGLLFLVNGVSEMVTRRSRLNGLIGVSSLSTERQEADLLSEALQPDQDATSTPALTSAPAAKA